MFDHIGLTVSNLPKAVEFYNKAFAPLGIKVLMDVTKEMTGTDDAFTGFGVDRATFWIGTGNKKQEGVHVAFLANDRRTVDAFHAAAIAAGGKDNGKPGVRPHYHENYYGAFVLDPDGNNIEAVCHKPG